MYIVCRPRIKSVKQLIITISVMKCSVNLDLITSKLNMLSWLGKSPRALHELDIPISIAHLSYSHQPHPPYGVLYPLQRANTPEKKQEPGHTIHRIRKSDSGTTNPPIDPPASTDADRA